jgi:hypothetical protein
MALPTVPSGLEPPAAASPRVVEAGLERAQPRAGDQWPLEGGQDRLRGPGAAWDRGWHPLVGSGR